MLERIVIGSIHEYRVNDQVVRASKYTARCLRIAILLEKTSKAAYARNKNTRPYLVAVK